jgi:hypothetical protein
MPTAFPLSLVVAWILMFGFVNTHQRHATRFQGSSQRVRSALFASTLLGILVALGLLVFYFTKVAWYWPLALFVVGSTLGAVPFVLLDKALGQLSLSLLGFVAWPASAIWFYVVVRSIAA